jgi:hypothetical protein
MELRSIEGESSISLSEWEADDLGIKAAIAVQDGAFSGASDEVWFFRDAFAAFVRALEQLVMRYEVEARLDSMSPEEVMLSIRPMESARHMLVEAQIAHGHYLSGHYFENRVCVTFELDPSRLPDIVRSLAAVIDDMDTA